VVAIAAATFMCAPDTLSSHMRLDDSNEVDSLRHLEFIMALERAFRIQLSPRETMAMSRLADAVEIVGRYLDDHERPAKIRA
jgi:acyl carrier protein